MKNNYAKRYAIKFEVADITVNVFKKPADESDKTMFCALANNKGFDVLYDFYGDKEEPKSYFGFESAVTGKRVIHMSKEALKTYVANDKETADSELIAVINTLLTAFNAEGAKYAFILEQ